MGINKLVGIDEVGRGAWAGPLVAGAVVLQGDIEGITDSKLLSKAQRQEFAHVIKAKAHAIGLGWVTPSEIDDIGLTQAVSLAMQRALEQIKCNFDEIIIDGNYNFLSRINCKRLDISQQKQDSEYLKDSTFHNNHKRVVIKTVIGADVTIPAVSAASIVAKIARDAHMAKQAETFPGYGFDKHVGYGTKQHLLALRTHGITTLHRLSYKPIARL